MKYQITKEQIEEIKELLNSHNTIKAKKILDELGEIAQDSLRDELRKYLMNQGKSSILKSDLWNLLDKKEEK